MVIKSSFLKNLVLISVCFIFAETCYALVRNKNKFESAFKQTLLDIQQNSIKNFEWDESDWQNYHNEQIKRLPIFTKKYFYECIDNALKDLHDHHSVRIKKHTQKNVTPTPKAPTQKFTVKVEDGIGIINVPTFITEVDQQDAILSEDWVTAAHKEIERSSSQVTHGWVIDLTQNGGGNMFPMLAALSYFYNESVLGGFCSRIKNKTEKALISFDGQSFKIDNQDFSYKTKYKMDQNKLPVVVLVGKHTASSGEFLALALKRQKHVILAGQESQGVATGNEVMQLPHDLGSYALTVAYYLDSNNELLLQEKVIPAITLKDNENMRVQAKQLLRDINKRKK